jgi:nitrate reductase cytochrome c-type subunit
MKRCALLLVVAIALLLACNQVCEEPLSEDQVAAAQSAQNENVASLGAPPMMPVEHPVIAGEDYDMSANGGEVCLECHNVEGEEEIPQTKHPERKNCVQCHLQATEEVDNEQDFKVGNDFKKYAPTL